MQKIEDTIENHFDDLNHTSYSSSQITNLMTLAGGLPFVLENADKGLHTKSGEDDGNPADGSKKNGFSTGFDHSDQIGFETDSTHGHDNEEFGQLFERGEEAARHTKRGKKGR